MPFLRFWRRHTDYRFRDLLNLAGRPDAEGGKCRRGCVRRDRKKGVDPQITQIDADGERARWSRAASRRDFLLLTYRVVSAKRNGSLQSALFVVCP